jgi:VCBS repeat protein/FG-GAP repeat protein
MVSMNGRLRDKALLFVLTALLTGNAFAQNVLPASSSSVSPSPVVSFGTLPVLTVSTPIPASNHAPSDFNGDGVSDLLWFNPTSSEVGYWTMTVSSSGAVSRTGAKTFPVTQGYFVGAVGDFNGDGFADLMFTSANRDLYLWTNNQHGDFTSQYVGTYPSNWQLIGAGDVDGDGKDDLLWLDPYDCEFAYWTMNGGVRTGYKIIPITCGYYPIGVGYYSPSNRISILWTSPANDLYVWDSTPSGFRSYNLFPSGGMANIWAIGGGYMGTNMGIEYYQPDANVPNEGEGVGSIYSRTFDANGAQTGFSGGLLWDGGASPNISAGYVVEGNGVNQTALYIQNQGAAELYVPNVPLTGSNFENGSYDTGNAALAPGYNHLTYPVGWWVVGAPGNGTVAPPWQ